LIGEDPPLGWATGVILSVSCRHTREGEPPLIFTDLSELLAALQARLFTERIRTSLE
jgi:hypothetical protein